MVIEGVSERALYNIGGMRQKSGSVMQVAARIAKQSRFLPSLNMFEKNGKNDEPMQRRFRAEDTVLSSPWCWRPSSEHAILHALSSGGNIAHST